MKAMILAAGRGERMRPLTDTLPKPLLTVAGKPLIVYHLEKLAMAGVVDVIVNIAYLGHKIKEVLGDGSLWGLNIHYSEEPEPLETAGALLYALPLLGDSPFLLINGDVWTDIDFADVIDQSSNSLAHLIFVNNPDHNLSGDYSLRQDIRQGLVQLKQVSAVTYTFSGIAMINPALIQDYPQQRKVFPLREVFDFFIEREQITGAVFEGVWCDVGTPERLQAIDAFLSQ